jgi:iron complex outermembrane receptor protein
VNNQSTNRKITPRLGVVYDLSSVASLFVGRSEGIKIPVLSLFSAPPKPEESSQTEVGLRITEWSGVTATLAWFDLTRKNVVIADPSRPGFSIQAGQQRSRGIDADVHWQATPAWAWLLAFTAQQAEISQDTNQSLVDKQLFNVPERSARLATRYDVKGGRWHGLGLGLGLTYRSRLPINSANTRFTPSATVWDAQLSYVHDSARYSVGVVNLLDKKYFVPSNYFGGNQVIPAQRRALTVAAQFSF